MIRLIHFADVHLGVENYGRLDPATGLSTRVADFLHCLDAVVDYALENQADLVLFAGDAYKTRDPNPTYQREFARRIQRLSRAGTPVFLLAGNHDTPNAAGRANTVEIFATLEVEGVQVAKRPGTHLIQTRHGPLQVVALPWVARSQLLTREEYKNRALDEVNGLILEKLEHILAAQIEELDPAMPTVLAAHGTVFGAVYGSEKSVMLGQEVVLPRSLVTQRAFAYAALGHIHKYQVLSDDPPAVYAGSIERLDFGEEKEEKGFLVVEIEDGRAAYHFLPLPARRFVTVAVEARGENPTAEVQEAIAAHDISQAVVRVIIRTTAEREALLRENDIRASLKEAFHVAAIAREVERPSRLRLGSGAVVAEMTPRELLERYWQAKQTPPDRVEVLLRHADELMASPS